MNKLDTTKIKLNNKRIIKNALRDVEYATKSDLSLLTGISKASITSLLSELIITNEVIELELDSPKGGRPARRFQYNKDYEKILLISLRKEDELESITCYVCDLLGNELYQNTVNTDVSLEAITDVIDGVFLYYKDVKYVSFGIPGILRVGEILTSDIEILERVHLKTFIEDKYDVQVSLENDVNAIAYGYYNSISKDSNPESLVYLYYPTNGEPGAGIVINNKVISGFQNLAGEVKYLEANSNKKIHKKILDTIHTLKYIINPEYIIISGYDITEKDKDIIQTTLSKQRFRTTVTFEPNIHDYYLSGLKFYAFEFIEGE